MEDQTTVSEGKKIAGTRLLICHHFAPFSM
jgi:hypothetical protein